MINADKQTSSLAEHIGPDAMMLPAVRGASRARRLIRGVGVQAASLAVFMTLWQIIGSTSNPVLFATPSKVVAAFIDLLHTGVLQTAFITSTKDLVVGYLIAVAMGMAVGLAMGRSPIIERILNPYVDFMQCTPIIAMVPLMVIWFGIGFWSRVAVVVILSTWSVMINVSAGVKGTPRILMEVAQVYHLSEQKIVTGIALPNAVPLIFAGLRIALGKALIGMIIGEIEISVVGLGGLAETFGGSFKTAYLLAAVLASSIVGVVTAALLTWSLGRFFPWVAATSAARE